MGHYARGPAAAQERPAVGDQREGAARRGRTVPAPRRTSKRYRFAGRGKRPGLDPEGELGKLGRELQVPRADAAAC